MTDDDYRRLGLLPPATRVPIPGGPQDIATVLDTTLRAAPDREALVGRHARFTYAALDAAANAAARGLAALGVTAGSRVASLLGNHPDAVVAFLATQRLGAVWVGMNHHLTYPERTALLADVMPSVLLMEQGAAEDAARYQADIPSIGHVVGVAPGKPDCAWAALLRDHAGAARPTVAIDPYAPASISFTSGTTGRPKGAVHCQHGIMACAWGANAGMRGTLGPAPSTLRRGTVGVTALNAMISGMLIPFAGGGAGVCVDRRDAAGIVEWIAAEQIAVISLATPVIYDLVHRAGVLPERLASLLFVTSLGAPVPPALRLAFEAKFGAAILAGYGQTEAPGPVAGGAFDHPPRGNAVGPAHLHVELAILDGENRPVPHRAQGEICVRAARAGPWAGVYTPMLGYWRRPEATEVTLCGGWLHTGDIGSVDAEGYLTIHDRLTDMVLRGGANVYPAEIEQVISSDPRVAAVAVVGRPDPRLGEIVVAFVQPTGGATAGAALEDELRDLCRSRLARYKIPQDWIFVDSFPRGATDKILKPALRARFLDTVPGANPVSHTGLTGNRPVRSLRRCDGSGR